MSCRFYQQWQDDDGVWYPAGWYESEDGEPCTPSGGAGNVNPTWTIGQGGATGGGGTYSTTLQGILSALAILHHQPYVPTTIQPAQQQPVYNSYAANPAYNPNIIPRSNNTLGSLQNFIQNNSGAALLVLLGAGLFLMRPPRRA